MNKIMKNCIVFICICFIINCSLSQPSPSANIAQAQEKMRKFHIIVFQDNQKQLAQQLAYEACEFGLAEGCIFSVFSESFDGKYQEKEFILRQQRLEQEQENMDKKALELGTKNCAQNIANECAIVAGIYERGDGVKVDIKKAEKFYEKACVLNSAQGCLEFNRIQEANNTAHPRILDKMLYLLQKECQRNDPFSCYMFGEWSIIKAVRNGNRSPSSHELQETKKYYEKACKLGFNPEVFGIQSSCKEGNVWQTRMDIISNVKKANHP